MSFFIKPQHRNRREGRCWIGTNSPRIQTVKTDKTPQAVARIAVGVPINAFPFRQLIGPDQKAESLDKAVVASTAAYRSAHILGDATRLPSPTPAGAQPTDERWREPAIYKQIAMGLDDPKFTDDQLIDAMLANPVHSSKPRPKTWLGRRGIYGSRWVTRLASAPAMLQK